MNSDKVYLAFFSTNGYIAPIIKLWEACWTGKNKKNDVLYNHVGLIFHASKLTQDQINLYNLNKDEYYIFESVLSGILNDGVKDTLGQTHFGVQLRSLNEVKKAIQLRNKKSFVDIIPLSKMTCISKAVTRYHSRSYDTSLETLLTIHLPNINFKKRKYRYDDKNIPLNFFCSDLIIRVLQDCGHADKSIDPKKVSPNTIFDLINLNEANLLKLW